ncbi:MAG: NADH-quinone oxidoreductase subunit NuoH [Anaerolineae bacterium]|jgi:NADH-quinone oxidoreductase subunit H|nr:NADH-quinone oxidoreductase subunit NuoH [Anaerolineae bacterium]MBT3712347.1 NADH-quinone oxidoreductase subunit NuoH [Anaerolineae bacterium]MBT4309310.1 NADH-quinone oxidoreductase subunit NuoH [Anaerolineae bacterium]MBT4460115.1 NADH-quinone oxidoreductase subunit NuoH [Anaerolineae bacterium]MBT4842980.1 NADH-quinone oxidoreductase subunit NuoH [Anaerolineae bacterium]
MDSALIWEMVIKALVLILALLTGFAYLTYYERRGLARIQSRLGPNRAGPQGLLQPVADAVKLIFKEEFIPGQAYKVIFILAPIITVVPAILITATVPWGGTVTIGGREVLLGIADINVGVLYIMSVASIAVYGVVLGGWASNNKYAMMGGLRSTAQMVSYELALGLSFVGVILLANSMRMTEIVEAQRGLWFAFLQPVGAVVFFFATLAELNRGPFDMPEAEQELSAGYNVEYSGMKFALFFMAEYTKMVSISAIIATLFWGGYRGPFIDTMPWLGPLYIFIKILIILFMMIWVRASWPRIRYDRLMDLGWKILLPLSLSLVFINAIGILLSETYGEIWIWVIFPISLIAGYIAVQAINLSLRRKENAR